MPVQRRKAPRTYRGMPTQRRVKSMGTRVANMLTRSMNRAAKSDPWTSKQVGRAVQMKHLHDRGYLSKKHYSAYRKSATGQADKRAHAAAVRKTDRKSGGGGGSRSEAARKAWVTRRGH